MPDRRRVPEATRPERWWWPLAAAATIGAIAVGILQVMPDRPDALEDEAAIVSDMPAGPTSQPAPSAAPAAERQAKPRVEPRVPVPATDDAKPAMPERRAADSATAFPAAPPATTTPPAPAAPAPAATPARMAQPFPAAPMDRRAAPLEAAARREIAGAGADAAPPTPPPPTGKLAAESAMGATSSTLAQQRAPLPVADWIALIRRLRAEGRDDEAARELAAFRRVHPDHPRLLPEDLRDWPPAAK